MSTWYKAGLVNVTQTNPIVAGIGTLFTLYVTAGDIFTRDGNKVYEVLSVDSNLQLTLTAPYAESTESNVAYAVIPAPGDPLESDVLTEMQDLITLWNSREVDMVEWLTGTGTVQVTTVGGGVVNLKTPQQLEADLATAAKTAAGAMVTGNTETGIAVTYQAGDQTLDFELQYAGSGAAATVARSDHTHAGVYAPLAHVHSGADITSGTVDVARLPTGTGGTQVALGNHNHAISSLTGTAISGAATGQVLRFNGTNWANASLATAGIAAASHTHAASDITGTMTFAQLPTGTSGSTVAIGNHTHTLDGLSDVSIVAPATNHVVYYNGAAFTNGTAATAGLAAAAHTHDATTAFSTGTVPLARLPTGTGGAQVALGNHTHLAVSVTDLAANVEAATGAMVAGNTETGITVTYAGGKLNFALLFAGTGVADTVARSDHTHTLASAAITDLAEVTQDTVGAMLLSGTGGLAGAYNDGAGTFTYTLQYAGSGTTYGTAVTVARSDHSHALTSASLSDFTEATQDVLGAMVAGNTETGIALTYDDTGGKLNAAITFGTTAGTAAEGNHTHATLAGLGVNTFTGNQTVSKIDPTITLTDTATGVQFNNIATASTWQVRYNNSQTTRMMFNSSGVFSAPTVSQTSDARLKTNITNLHNAAELTAKLEPVRYNWIDSDVADIGLLAQDVRRVVPEAVHEDENGYLTLSYGTLVPILIGAIKELQHRVHLLERNQF